MKFDNYRVDTQCLKGHFLPDLSLEELNKYFEETHVNFYNCIKHRWQFSSFCIPCQENICELCEPNHNGHNNVYQLKSKIPDKNIIKKAEDKINQQKKQIDEINNVLNNFLKVVNEKTKEYQNKLNIDLKLKTQIFNCMDVERPN